jgi:hypothetical protein
MQRLFERQARVVNRSCLRGQQLNVVKVLRGPAFCGQLVTTVPKQNIEPLVKRPRRVKPADCLESVNKSFLNGVLSIIPIEQNSDSMSDRTFLIPLDNVPKRFPVTLLTSFNRLGIIHRRLTL